ncbi:MAG: ribosome biogenesis GTPase YlqF [Acidaminococcaceae bacterium]|nr:ribosome biogenesis GTPase YlqF [Acidaminococcaceae bacterium]HCJ90631.1 ribosome biogenesis GTPase YlqF [Acidaminococcaceae bacterium]
MELKDFKIQWFPGHMTKAKRMMESQIRLVDVVVELLDARIPASSVNPMLREIAGSKPRVIALNKADMADPVKTEAWLARLKQDDVPVCVVDCSKGKGVKQMLALVREAARPVTEKWLKKGVRNHPIRMMIVGVPNVGKSTLINRLVGRVKAIASDRPGVTKQKQWVTIAKGIELLDTPGVLWPKFENPGIGLHLALTGAVREEVFDRHQAAELLLQELLRKYPDQLAAFYGIGLTPDETAATLIAKIGRVRGAIKAGGVLDENKVIQHVLYDFKTAKMGRFTLDEP